MIRSERQKCGLIWYCLCSFFFFIYCSQWKERKRESALVCACESLLFFSFKFYIMRFIAFKCQNTHSCSIQHIKCDLSNHQRIERNDISLFASNLKRNTWLEEIKEKKKMKFPLYIKKIESMSILFLFTQTTDLWCVMLSKKML